ncbi:hypothetical protein IIC68_02760, partial [archaeon]|nr:hypothetical protein [archaeon]
RNKGEEVSGCNIRGKLKPIGVEYVSEKPTLYTRIMGQNAKPMDITLYTIGKVPYYVPGTTVFYSQRITSSAFDNAQSIESFGGVGDWLTRSTMRLNFDEIDRDIVLLPGTDELSIDGLNERPRIVNPDLMVKGDGVVNTHEYSELNFDQPEKAAPNGIGLSLFLFGDSLGGLAQVIGLIFPLLALMLLAPVSLLLFIFPITLGILFTRKKAALSTFLGTIVGLVVLTVLVTIIGSLYLFSSSISQSFYALTALGSLLIGSFILALIPASLFGLVAFLSSNYLRKNKFVEQTQNYFNKMPLKISAAFVALLVLLNVVLAILFVIVQNDSSNLLNPIPWLIVYAISFYGFYKFSQDFIKKYKSVKVELKKNDWHIFIILLVVFMIFQFGLAALFMGFPIF